MINVNQEKLKEVKIKEAQQNRASAYKEEADPLAFKMLRGEITKEEWEAKIEEIRNRFPYPEAF
jgi:translation elongation factor EF-1beta